MTSHPQNIYWQCSSECVTGTTGADHKHERSFRQCFWDCLKESGLVGCRDRGPVSHNFICWEEACADCANFHGHSTVWLSGTSQISSVKEETSTCTSTPTFGVCIQCHFVHIFSTSLKCDGLATVEFYGTIRIQLTAALHGDSSSALSEVCTWHKIIQYISFFLFLFWKQIEQVSIAKEYGTKRSPKGRANNPNPAYSTPRIEAEEGPLDVARDALAKVLVGGPYENQTESEPLPDWLWEGSLA